MRLLAAERLVTGGIDRVLGVGGIGIAHDSFRNRDPNNDRHNVFHQSLALGVPITEKIGFYIEYIGLYTDGRASDYAAHFVNGGFTYLLSYDTQFDIRAGQGLNDLSEDFFGGIGLSKRF